MTEPPALKPGEFARWIWRQLTSMRTALILLFLLALGAVPGSVIPQEAVDSVRVAQWKDQHPTLAPIYDKLQLFSVFDSVWFSAIYLLLVISLVGCVLPRARVYWKSLRAKPPRAPRNLTRLPHNSSFESPEPPELMLDRAAAALKARRFRIQVDIADGSVAADRGRLREAGNLLFHLSVLVVLAGFAIGSLFGYKGGVIVVNGGGFANSLSQYDDFNPGGFFHPSKMAPFEFKVTDFDVTFLRQGPEIGMAHNFSAGIDYRASPTSAQKKTRLAVNHPLSIDGTKVYLIGHGYAPHITVRDGSGHVAYSGPTVFLPEDSTFRSFGVVKVPDAVAKDGKPEQLGLEGEFYPTYAFTNATGPFSAFPDATNPAISMLVYRGDLGLDSGVPQNVYALDKAGLKPVLKADDKPLRIDLAMGKTAQLPDHLGSVTLNGVSRFIRVQVSRSPGDWVTLLGVCLALLGLLGSLYIRPRRVWVRVRRSDEDRGGVTLVEIAGLDRSVGGDITAELAGLIESLKAQKENL